MTRGLVVTRTAAAAVLALMLCWAWAAFADVAIPALTGRVVDQTATLTPDQAAALEQKLKAFEDRKGTQIAVLIVPTTEPETIEQFSIRVAEAWKIGRKKIDDGALLVVAKNDRTLRIEVGYGLEGALTDVTSFSSGRVTTYCFLLVFYTAVVMVVVWLCGLLRAWLESRKVPA